MKKQCIYALWAMMAAAFFFCGCESKNPVPDPEVGVPAPPLSVCVIKLAKPEYKNMILVSHFEGEDFYTNLRGNFCGEPIGKAGYSPYWELPDGWLLVDWKWSYFPYEISAVLTEQTWDKYIWSRDNYPQWPLTEPHEDSPIGKELYIHVANLDIYSHGDKWEYRHSDMITKIHQVYGDELYKGDDCLCKQTKTMDSIWTVLQTDLSVAIEKGDLEKINNDEYYDQKYYDNY